MVCLQDFFDESKGQPVVYKGQLIQINDSIKVVDGQKLKLVIESTDSDFLQGIYLTSNGGVFDIDNQLIEESIVLWEDTAPEEVYVTIAESRGICKVKNVWQSDMCKMDSGCRGAAMIVEKIPNGRRYRCNDGKPDDDFNDIVFRIEFVDSNY